MSYKDFQALSESIRSAIMSRVSREMPCGEGYSNISVVDDKFSCMAGDGSDMLEFDLSSVKLPRPKRKQRTRSRKSGAAKKKVAHRRVKK